MKKCPSCAEEIQDEAIRCRYCGAAIPSSRVRDLLPRYGAMTKPQQDAAWAALSPGEQAAFSATWETEGWAARSAAAQKQHAQPFMTKPAGCVAQAIGALFALGLLTALTSAFSGDWFGAVVGAGFGVIGVTLFVMGGISARRHAKMG